MKTLIATALLGIAASLTALPAFAEPSFKAEKVCGMSRAPKGFKRVDVFVETAKYFRPLFDVYVGADQKSIFVSNIKDFCWLEIEFPAPFLSLNGTPPTFLDGTIHSELKSRALADDAFWGMVSDCGDNEKLNVAELYYQKRFYRDYYIVSDPDGESLCFQALGYGSDAFEVKLSRSTLFVDIIGGTAYIGEMK